MADDEKKPFNYKQERALFFARNRGRTQTRIWFLFIGSAFFLFTAIARTFFVSPFAWWDLSGFVFAAGAAWAALAVRRLLAEGDRLLAERGETPVRPKLRDLKGLVRPPGSRQTN
jgi:hypothetical protein